MKKLLVSLLLLLMVLSACGSGKVTPVDSSDTLFVRKIEGIPEDFIMGMDASSVISLENSGVTYYGYNGKETDVFKTLAESGINYIRVRVWNDPYDAEGHGYGGGNCDIDTAVAIGKRATKYGMKLLVDFHYSDFWADPGKQMVPKAWDGMSIEEKKDALYDFTRDSLKKLKDAKVDVGMVSLGNETNGAMAGEKIWMNIIYHLMGAGSKAVREVYPEALIAVHFANPENGQAYRDYAKKLAYYDLDYDVFASSYYPYWHGTLENLQEVLNDIATTYDKKVMVMETSYAYTPEDSDFFANTIGNGSAVVKNYPYTVQGQANSVLDVIDTVVHTKNGIGVCYWEGTWISAGGASYEENLAKWEEFGSGWASSYSAEYDPEDAGKWYGGSAVDNQAFFDKDGHPLESLKLFALCRSGNEAEVRADAIEDVNMAVDLNGEIVLPDTVNALMTDGSRKEVSVTWNSYNEEEMRSNGPKTYEILGEADGLTAHCYVSMIEYNFLENYSFEADEHGTRVPEGWVLEERGSADELYVENKPMDSLSGDQHYHFWSAAMGSVDFDLYQEVTGLEKGTYKYTISMMGGDCGKTYIYAYAFVNDNGAGRAPITIQGYGNWDTVTIDGIKVKRGQTVKVGVHVYCVGEGNGAWAKIDDAMLNSVTEE